MTWNAYLAGARTKYRPNDTTPITSYLTVNAVKGQFACWQIPMKIDGEDVTTVDATCTTPTCGVATLGVPLIYKAYLHNIHIPSRRANWGGLGTNLGNPIGEIPDALVPKVDAFYSETRNAFPFSINRISPVYEVPSIDLATGGNSCISMENTARIVPTIEGTYSGTGLKNYHIVMEDATHFRWTNQAFNIKKSQWNPSGNVATITTYQNHGFSAGNTVRVKTSRSAFNGSFTILDSPAPTATAFSYVVTGLPSQIYYDGGGTAIKTWNEINVATGSEVALDNGLNITFPTQSPTYATEDEWEFYVNTTRVETIWMESYVPTDAVAGDYTSTITISASGKSNITLNLTIRVYNLAIGREPTIPIFYGGSEDAIIRGHFNQSEIYSGSPDPVHLAIVQRHQESALRHRMSLSAMGPYIYWSGNTLMTNWDSVIKPFLSRYLDGTWTEGVEPTGMKWSVWKTRIPGLLSPYNTFATQSSLYLTDFSSNDKIKLATFAASAEAEGWMSTHQPYFLPMDEPYYYTGSWLTAITNAHQGLEDASPYYRVLMTRSLVPGWIGLVDAWNTNILSMGPRGNPVVDNPRFLYDAELAAGKELWVYQGCDSKYCFSIGPDGYDAQYIWGVDYNTTVDIDSPMTDLIGYHWLMFDNDVRGDLYYAVNEAMSFYQSYYTLEYGDSNNYLSSFVINGSTPTNTDRGRLYWNFTGATKTVDIYKDSSKTQLVASGSRTGAGSIALTEQNSSGLTGSVTVIFSTPNNDTDSANFLYPRAQQDVWDTSMNYGGNAEGTFWYPGRAGSTKAHSISASGTDIPIESLRLKAWRMGQEDYEIFKIANGGNNDPTPYGCPTSTVTTTNTSLTETRLAMVTNKYVGATITCNGKTLVVTSNNATTFTGTAWSGGGNPGNAKAWYVNATSDICINIENAVGAGKWRYYSPSPAIYGVTQVTESNMDAARTSILDGYIGQPPNVIPTVATTELSSIAFLTASSGGNVTYDGGGTVTARGVCWSTSINPTTSDSNTTDGSGTGVFTSAITGLTRGTQYYVRAYATNEIGTAYGGNMVFTTLTYGLVIGAGGSIKSGSGGSLSFEW